MKSNFYIEFYEPTQIFVHRIVNHFVRPEFLLNTYDISLHIRLRSFMIYNSLVPFVKAQVSLEELTSRFVARIWECKTEKIIRAVFISFCTTSFSGRGQTAGTRSINQSWVYRSYELFTRVFPALFTNCMYLPLRDCFIWRSYISRVLIGQSNQVGFSFCTTSFPGRGEPRERGRLTNQK